jgi:hypothetical protein
VNGMKMLNMQVFTLSGSSMQIGHWYPPKGLDATGFGFGAALLDGAGGTGAAAGTGAGAGAGAGGCLAVGAWGFTAEAGAGVVVAGCGRAATGLRVCGSGGRLVDAATKVIKRSNHQINQIMWKILGWAVRDIDAGVLDEELEVEEDVVGGLGAMLWEEVVVPRELVLAPGAGLQITKSQI